MFYRVSNGGSSDIEYTGPYNYSFTIVKSGTGWGRATGSQTISTGIIDSTFYPAVLPTATSGYGDNVGVSLSYNANNGNLTINGSSDFPSNDSVSYHVEGKAYLFKKTFFDFSMTISKSDSGWATARGSTTIQTNIHDSTKKAVIYFITNSGYNDIAYVGASYDSTTGIITLTGNTEVSTNGAWSCVVTGVVLLI